MNVPNKLTLARIILTPIFMMTMLIGFPYHYAVALVLFAVASLTDMIDGKMARKNHLVTDFGKFLDPLADKMLTTAAYIGFIYVYRGSPVYCIIVTVVTFLVLFREFAVSSIRLVTVSSGGKVIAANVWGKAKTVSQMIGLIAALFYLSLGEFVTVSSEAVNTAINVCIMVLFCISGVLCIISGCIYLAGSRDYIDPTK